MSIIDLCLDRVPGEGSGRWSSRLYRCCSPPSPEELDLTSGQLNFKNMRAGRTHTHTEHDIPVNYFCDLFYLFRYVWVMNQSHIQNEYVTYRTVCFVIMLQIKWMNERCRWRIHCSVYYVLFMIMYKGIICAGYNTTN